MLKRIGRDEATKLLSLTQALDAALIQRHESSWDWEQLSGNEALPWSLELIERFEDRWTGCDEENWEEERKGLSLGLKRGPALVP